MSRSLLALYLILLLTSSFLVSAQEWPSSEMTALQLYDAELPPVNAGCNFGMAAPCFENDGGYNPMMQGVFEGYFSAVSPFTSANGNVINWQITGNNQCVADIEICDPASGQLIEALCGSNMNVGDPSAFNAVFPQHLWLGTEPAALASVNCSIYALNNPWLGLQGFCMKGACV